MNTTLAVEDVRQTSDCDGCGTQVERADSGVDVSWNPAGTLQVFTFCPKCATTLALGLIARLTGDAWGVSATRQAQAVQRARQKVVESARDLILSLEGVSQGNELSFDALLNAVRHRLDEPLDKLRSAETNPRSEIE